MAPLRIGIVGTGHMAQTMAAVVAATEGVSVAGFHSRDPARAAALVATHGGRAFDASADLFAGSDAIYIANNTAAHAATALAALAAGRPVLCEKPCALDAAQAAELAAAARASGVLFMEAVATPFLPAVAEALRAADEGDLGQARQLSASFGYPTTPDSHPGLYRVDGGGVLLDRAVYLLWLARLALGPVVEVEAMLQHRDGVDVDATILLRHASGATSTLAASIVAELDNRLCIAGAAGSALVEPPLLGAERVRIARHGTIARPAPAGGGLAARVKGSGPARALLAAARGLRASHRSYGGSLYAPELVHFRDLVRAGATESPILPPERSVEIMQLVDRVREVAR